MFSSWLPASTTSAALIRTVIVIGVKSGASAVRLNTLPVALKGPERGGISPDETDRYTNWDGALTAPAPTSIVTSPSGEISCAALSGYMGTITVAAGTTPMFPSSLEDVKAPDANKPPNVAPIAAKATNASIPYSWTLNRRGPLITYRISISPVLSMVNYSVPGRPWKSLAGRNDSLMR